jgi:hypothetical protein
VFFIGIIAVTVILRNRPREVLNKLEKENSVTVTPTYSSYKSRLLEGVHFGGYPAAVGQSACLHSSLSRAESVAGGIISAATGKTGGLPASILKFRKNFVRRFPDYDQKRAVATSNGLL